MRQTGECWPEVATRGLVPSGTSPTSAKTHVSKAFLRIHNVFAGRLWPELFPEEVSGDKLPTCLELVPQNRDESVHGSTLV